MMVIIFIRAVKRKPKSTSDLKKVKMVESKYDKHDIRYLKKQQNREVEEELRRNKESEDKEEIQLKELEEEGVEISGYIDLAHRLKTEDFTQYFKGQKLLLPKNTDLSYYNWNTGVCVSNDSPNFKVDASSGTKGLLFRNKRDRKVINVDPEQVDGNDSTHRKPCVPRFPEYKQIVFFDHETRRKA
jgi:5-formyltetrahydrofolate cyclo-ligase